MTPTRVILDHQQFQLTLDRLCRQLIENHQQFENTCLIGIQPRGVELSDRICERLQTLVGSKPSYGTLDITFYRDDFRRSGRPLLANDTSIRFSIENKKVVLIDDVFFTGRTIRSALDAILDFGRPEKVELLTLIYRRFCRDVPIKPDYIGQVVDTITSEYVRVEWGKENEGNKVWILNKDEK